MIRVVVKVVIESAAASRWAVRPLFRPAAPCGQAVERTAAPKSAILAVMSAAMRMFLVLMSLPSRQSRGRVSSTGNRTRWIGYDVRRRNE
jgi:hypothetical protein